jgi:hypothetical protein
MLTIPEWTEVYNRYKMQLGLPCVLLFDTSVKTAVHRADDEGTCTVTINPDVDFKRPEHLILHEFAHHRTLAPVLFWYWSVDGVPDDRLCCLGWTGGHCKHWAQDLCDIYRETGTALPYSTMFEEFATAAGIKQKLFDPEAMQFNGDK